MNPLKKFWGNVKARVNMGAIIGLVLGVTLAAYMLPDAIVALTNETLYTGAPTAVITMMTTVAGLVVAAVFLLMLYRGSKS